MNLRTSSLVALATSLALNVACSTAPDFIFGGAIDGVPGVVHVEAEAGGPLVPAVITTPEEARAATVYLELGPTGDASPSGATYRFTGTGGAVCAFVDPELIFWNQAVSTQSADRRWRYPDNPYDDGDIDLHAGLSVYYTGTEGEEVGDFLVDYEDTLGNPIDIDLVACTITADVLGPTNPASAGRGAPEYCTIFNTQPGVSYTVALEVFSTPPDDNRLSFGMLLADGTCGALIATVSPAPGGVSNTVYNEECVIVGESLIPVEGESAYHHGYQEGRSWAGSEDFEDFFCSGERISQFCNQEATAMEEAGLTCQWETIIDPAARCYCGDERDTPSGGAF